MRNSTFRSNWIKKNLVFFAIAFSVYIVNRFLKSSIENPFIGYLCRCHLNDYIGGIVFCIYVNMILIIAKRNPIVSFRGIIALMVPVAIVWEYVFPLILPYSTSDIIDVLSYVMGACTYYILMCRNQSKNSIRKIEKRI